MEQNLGTRLLSCVPILAKLSEEKRSQLFSKLRLVTYNEEEIIANGSIDTFYIIKEGDVEIREIDNQQENLEVLGAGQYFGQKQIKSTENDSLSAKALTKCEIFQLDK